MCVAFILIDPTRLVQQSCCCASQTSRRVRKWMPSTTLLKENNIHHVTCLLAGLFFLPSLEKKGPHFHAPCSIAEAPVSNCRLTNRYSCKTQSQPSRVSERKKNVFSPLFCLSFYPLCSHPFSAPDPEVDLQAPGPGAADNSAIIRVVAGNTKLVFRRAAAMNIKQT